MRRATCGLIVAAATLAAVVPASAQGDVQGAVHENAGAEAPALRLPGLHVPAQQRDDARVMQQSQPRRQTTPRPPGTEPPVRLRLSGHLGYTSFTARDSFEAVLDTSSGAVFGAGGGVLVGRNVFVDVQVSRFTADGERVFVTDTLQVFPLGIPTTVTVTPIDVSFGWRFAPGRPRPGTPAARPGRQPALRPVPFVGGGFGTLRYREVAEFAQAGDDVDDSFLSYHLLGGVDLPFTRRFGLSADALYRWVPDALGDGGVSAVYGDTDLGGVTFRVKATITF
jgi:hypothetical protein